VGEEIKFMTIGDILFNIFIFPGAVFSVALGMLASWIDRKITARIQYRVGPPLMQPYYDIRKLFSKEIVLPQPAGGGKESADGYPPATGVRGATWIFVAAPVVAFAASVAASAIIISSGFLGVGFYGDIFLVIYLLMIPPLATILGGLSSGNPLSSVGASREIKLMMGYEAIFILLILSVIIKTGSVSISDIVEKQLSSGGAGGVTAAYSPYPVIFSISGFIAFLLFIVVMQAKLGFVPFDMAEAETELAGGIYMEYSGPLLAFFKLSKTVLLAALPFLGIALFAPSGGLTLIVKFLLLVILITLIRNTSPRFRIDHALRILWKWGIIAGFASVAASILGY